MTDRRVSQVIAEVAETPTTDQRRVSQAIAEVAESPTTQQRRVSQIVAEISYTQGAAPATVAGVGSVPETNDGFPTISGVVFRLKAVDVGGSDGDAVSTWPDRSGNNHTFTGSSTTRPLKKVNIAGPSSDKPGILFDGSDDYMDGGDLQSVFPSAATIFIVFQPTSSDQRYALARNTGVDGWTDFDGAGYPAMWRTSRISSVPSSGIPNSGRHSYALKSSSSTYRTYLDGTGHTAQSAAYADGEAYFYIGGGAPSDPQGQNRAFTGYLFEVVAFDTALSDSDINLLEAYAEAYWGFGSTGRPSVTAGTGAVPAPTVFSTAAPVTTAGIGAVPAPTAIGGADAAATPSATAGVGAVPAPTAIGSAAGEATPNVVVGVGAVPAPSANGSAFASPSTTVGTGAVPAPTVTGVAGASPDVVAGVGFVPDPSAFGVVNNIASPSVVAGIVRIYRPTFPSSTDPGGGGGGSGGSGVSEVSALWHIDLY